MTQMFSSWIFVSLLFLVSSSTSTTSIVSPSPTSSGGSEPTFFVTFHGGDGKKDVNDVYRYSLSGALLQKGVFSNGVAKGLHGLRGLLYVKSKEILLVTNAFKLESRIIKLDVGPTSGFACTGQGLAIDFIADGTVLHPYGIHLNPIDQSITISNQGDVLNPPQNITQYDLNGNSLSKPVFTTVGDPRGLYWDTFEDNAFLFICDKSTDKVLKFTSDGTQMPFTAKVRNPIALHTVPAPSGEGVVPWLLVSSNDPNDSAVYALDFVTGGDTTGSKTSFKRRYSDPQLGHPCGMVHLGNVLYVLSQDTYSLLSFDLVTARMIAVVVSSLPDIPEDLMLVSFPACALSPTSPTVAPPTTTTSAATEKVPPLYFIVAGTVLGVALATGTIFYWCRRRRGFRKAPDSKHAPLAKPEEDGLIPPVEIRGSVHAVN